MGLRGREICLGLVSFAPSGACVVSALYPRLAPWAAFFRRFAALQFHANFGCAPSVRLIAAQETRGIRTARSGPSLGKRKNASFGMTIPKSDVVHSSRRQASSLYLVRLIRTRRARPVFEHEVVGGVKEARQTR